MFRLLKRTISYCKLSPKQKLEYIPPNPPPLEDFLSSIGRKASEIKAFESTQQLLTMPASKMQQLAIKPKLRKYILSSREWYKRTGKLAQIELPKRQNKYLKRKEQVKLLRLKKLGLA